jgi:hypothetical protein
VLNGLAGDSYDGCEGPQPPVDVYLATQNAARREARTNHATALTNDS